MFLFSSEGKNNGIKNKKKDSEANDYNFAKSIRNKMVILYFNINVYSIN